MDGFALLVVVLAVCAAYQLGKRAGRGGAGEKSKWDGDDWFFQAKDPQRAHAKLEIRYRDARGDVTRRKIRVRKFDERLSGGILLAHCYLRGADRSFRFDRIQSCTDLDTGEVVRDIRSHLIARSRGESPKPIEDELVAENKDLLRALFFVALADGELQNAEAEVVARYLRELTNNKKVSPTAIAKAAEIVGRPSLAGFKQAVGRLINSGEVSPVLLAGRCRQIAEADGYVTPEEREALEYLDRRILSGADG